MHDEVAGASGDPDARFRWIYQSEWPNVKIDDLADSGEFASLDARLAAGIARVAQDYLGRAISAATERMTTKGTLVTDENGGDKPRSGAPRSERVPPGHCRHWI